MTTDHNEVARPKVGPIRGTRGADDVLRFAGVQYGHAQRFAQPTAISSHSFTIDAFEPGPICPQLGSRLEAAMGEQWGEPPQSEDCLYLSIATPELSGSRPVMVWLHGGGFLTGAGTLPWHDGGRMAAGGDVVLVSVNYRVGAFGYLVHEDVSEGNLGLQDQMLALEWVRDNIAAFGGDPSNVTLFGQSAGALSTVALLSVPGSRALVHRAIIQSCPSLDLFQDRNDALDIGAYFADAVDGDLATASVEAILEGQRRTLQWNAAKNPKSTVPPFGLVLDQPLSGNARNSEVFLSEPMPELMIGYTSDECAAFAIGVQDREIHRALTELSQDLIIAPSQEIARDYEKAGGTVYSYEFVWKPQEGGYGAIHCLELPFLMGTEESWKGSPMLGGTPWVEVERNGKQLRELWTNFARFGSPVTRGLDWSQSPQPIPLEENQTRLDESIPG